KTRSAAVILFSAPTGIESGGGKDPLDRSFADAVAEADEFALDAAVAPPRVLPGQSLDEFADFVRDRRASDIVRVGPLVPKQAPVPGEQGARRDNPVQPQACGQEPGQGGDHGAVGPVRP